ncbi:MAG: glycosyltransferase [Candidatus Bathyarchaeia archaeon]
MKNCLVNEYSIRKNKVFVIPHGVEAPLIENICIKKDLKNNVILFFGFITPDKGVEVLIDAFSKITNILPKVKLLILGSYRPRLYKENPNYIGAIEKKLKETKLNDKVIFEDKFVNDNYLQSYIQIADIIVFPYIDENVIGASGALASCINFGKPIIATNIPRFNTELKNGVNSILVNPNDKEELYKALIKLLLDEELRIKLSLNIKNLGKERSWFNIAIKTMEVYNKFL